MKITSLSQCHSDEETEKFLAQKRKEDQASRMEPLWYLRSIPYPEYRGTHYWKKRAADFINSFEEKTCELCGIQAVHDDEGERLDWLPRFHVHHKTYEHLGAEPDEDLALLCSACHNLVHYPDSHAAQFWIKFQSIFLATEMIAGLRPTKSPPLYEPENDP